MYSKAIPKSSFTIIETIELIEVGVNEITDQTTYIIITKNTTIKILLN